ncbi:helix-turn-helix domain-containing protein [Klebsiella pneumoniae]|uniref:helix-turn-helix domain-containing protein n=1 Tax=Klebsiella pneumoniae TaxID=573 RepID=UPI002249171D|nr:helix-turn-helix domain-containing protein [Klebsiella pneumoniae]
MSKARLLIEKEKLPAKKIAAECGFSGPDVMRRGFSRLTGITPTAYRLPPTAYRLPPTAYRLPPTAYRLPPTGRW